MRKYTHRRIPALSCDKGGRKGGEGENSGTHFATKKEGTVGKIPDPGFGDSTTVALYHLAGFTLRVTEHT